MTDKFKGWYPDYIENEKEREPILKLAKMMTGRAKKKLGLEKMTKYDPEYWGLALLCTDEQAEIALKMGVRQPKTLDQMVKVTGKDRGYLEKQLEEMAEVALVEYNWEKDLQADMLYLLNEAIRAVGVERGYAYIINTDGNTCPFINPTVADDVTNYVKEKLQLPISVEP